MTRRLVLPVLALVALAAAGCGGSRQAPVPGSAAAPELLAALPSMAGHPLRRAGLMLPGRVHGTQIELAVGGGFRPRFWGGVNIGSTVPGRQPGEVAATRADYERWFPQIARLGARVIRIYTILGPDFYQALRGYNLSHPRAPLYLVHGVWIPEERFLATGNAYDRQVTSAFRHELRDAVAVVHGDATLPLRRGHAGGRYAANVSRWTIAWSIGVEWDPKAAKQTDTLNAGRPRYRGRYVTTRGTPTPMESWIASMLDHTAALEAARGWSRPVTFTNWVTADPLRHPNEPLAKEDMVSIDAMHLRATPRWPGGLFASYHVYPYYPDFLGLQPNLVRYRRPWDGKLDPYAGYLHLLRRHHRGQALMVTEFGVPTSLGLAHRGPLGRNQGAHSEAEAGAMDAAMLDDIRRQGLAGGLLFEWVDEWFKFTWNTWDTEQPGDRRQLWRNPLTNEEHFGVVALEPGQRPAAVLDGKDDEWLTNRSQVIAESRGPVREVRAVKDEEYLYLRLGLDRDRSWQRDPITIGLDVRPGGNRGLPGLPGVDANADVAVVLGRDDRARIRWASWVDPIPFQYGRRHGYVRYRPTSLKVDSGVWVEPRLILNKPYVVPASGGRRHATEQSWFGNLPWGTSAPASSSFDDRHLVDAHGHVVELRLPWSLLTYADPSSHLVVRPRLDGSVGTLRTGRVGIAVAAAGHELRTTGYDWEPWNRVSWHERPKGVWGPVQAGLLHALARGPVGAR